MTTLLVSGYRSFDLGIFKENDERILIIKKLSGETQNDFVQKDWNGLFLQAIQALNFGCQKLPMR